MRQWRIEGPGTEESPQLFQVLWECRDHRVGLETESPHGAAGLKADFTGQTWMGVCMCNQTKCSDLDRSEEQSVCILKFAEPGTWNVYPA